MTQRADCSLIHHTGSPVPLGFPLSCPSHLALRQHCLVLASMAMCASFTRILMSFYLSFAYTFLCALCTYLFRLYSPSPPSPRIQSSMSLTLPNKALVGTSMYIRSTLQLIAERPHQNLIPRLRSRNVLRVSCSYLLFSRRHHIKPDLDAVELSSTPYSPTFSPRFSHLPTRFRLCGTSIRVALALRPLGFLTPQFPSLVLPLFLLSPSSYRSLSTPVEHVQTILYVSWNKTPLQSLKILRVGTDLEEVRVENSVLTSLALHPS